MYSGEGPSKTAAKAAAAECAVKGLILKKISEAGIKKMESKESLGIYRFEYFILVLIILCLWCNILLC